MRGGAFTAAAARAQKKYDQDQAAKRAQKDAAEAEARRQEKIEIDKRNQEADQRRAQYKSPWR